MSPKGKEKPAAISGKQRGRPFPKGTSGNPSGRPAVARDFRERCREWMESEGWDLMIRDAKLATHMGAQARELIAAYAYGKPSQKLDLAGANGEQLKIIVEYVRTPSGS